MFHKSPPPQNALRTAISNQYRSNETQIVKDLLQQWPCNHEDEEAIADIAANLITTVRQELQEQSAIQAFMQQYDLSTEEGILLMCLAESLLRVPDHQTEQLLIRDKLTDANWQEHVGQSESVLVNWATWGLALTGQVLDQRKSQNFLEQTWQRLIERCSEPVIRKAVHAAIKIMSEHFILGYNIHVAEKAAAKMAKQGYHFSFDMLGEVARTMADADRYFHAYLNAIHYLAEFGKNPKSHFKSQTGISVKLSALYPRFEPTQVELARSFLTDRVITLANAAMQANINLTIDAEEADRLEMTLDIFAHVFKREELANWSGLGLAVQAYQKRALPVLEWLIALGREHQKKIPVRLVKGAYWDTEIKLSQLGGFAGYPVFTRKTSTDLSYIVCAYQLLNARDVIYPQFATHNAYTIAAILNFVQQQKDHSFEFQSLQGMGKELQDILLQQGYQCCIYAPVGSYRDLLPYLVRRLLENGANSSFVNQIADRSIPQEALIRNPHEELERLDVIPHPYIPLPRNIFGKRRFNSAGIDLSNSLELRKLNDDLATFLKTIWEASSHTSDRKSELAKLIYSPNNRDEIVGKVWEAEPKEIENAITIAKQAWFVWNEQAIFIRANILRIAAELIEKNYPELIMLLMREAGKTITAAIAEVREAVDYCRYYAAIAEEILVAENLQGPTGETDVLQMQGRGIFLCISPWNFPIAIFTGQIVAALVAGNAVIAKPAEQTPLVAARIVEILLQAGVPPSVLHLLPGRGEVVGAACVADKRINGILFTGGTETAAQITKTLAERSGSIIPFIAETGGINAMIADSTALPEQLIADVITSAFDSAGQRCSALRVLCVQEDIADQILTMLQGAMAELRMGNSNWLMTDVGPVIDQEAFANLQQHQNALQQNARLVYSTPLTPECESGHFIPPEIYEITDLNMVTQEIFGPILLFYRYRRSDLEKVVHAINQWGYGLTFGIHSRINATIQYLSRRVQAGNIYINRNMIGAVVGVQPFGGMHLSGTGPKAGGPHYLLRLCNEKTISNNLTAIGGNTRLLALR